MFPIEKPGSFSRDFKLKIVERMEAGVPRKCLP